jgi:pyridoxal phosphate enzyme (YggS family)
VDGAHGHDHAEAQHHHHGEPAAPGAVAGNLAAARERVRQACARSHRPVAGVLLVAVSKTMPVDLIRSAAEAGQRDFGENYAHELRDKAAAVPGVRWHFLGKLQRGTVRHVADLAAVVHSGEPGEAVELLGRRAAGHDRRVDLLAQVDFTGRRQGADPDELESFLERLHELDGIRPVGLMTLPPPTPDPEDARPFFARLRELRDGFAGRWPGLVELSMGMSGDYEVAVEEGATMIRLGTALFGERPALGSG